MGSDFPGRRSIQQVNQVKNIVAQGLKLTGQISKLKQKVQYKQIVQKASKLQDKIKKQNMTVLAYTQLVKQINKNKLNQQNKKQPNQTTLEIQSAPNNSQNDNQHLNESRNPLLKVQSIITLYQMKTGINFHNLIKDTQHFAIMGSINRNKFLGLIVKKQKNSNYITQILQVNQNKESGREQLLYQIQHDFIDIKQKIIIIAGWKKNYKEQLITIWINSLLCSIDFQFQKKSKFQQKIKKLNQVNQLILYSQEK